MPTTVDITSDVAAKRRKYNRLMTEAETAYKQAVDAAYAEFEKITGPAQQAFDKAVAPIKAEFDKATKDAADKRNAAIVIATVAHNGAHVEASKEAGYTE